MKRFTRTLWVVLILAHFGTLPAFSQIYNGPPVDVNFENKPIKEYRECEQYDHLIGVVSSACHLGLDEARRMAERYAGGQGRIQGFLRGYSWGLFDRMRLTRDDAGEISAGQKLADGMGQYMESGLKAGREQAERDGKAHAVSDAIQRFVSKVDQLGEPDPTVVFPVESYKEESNPYEKFVGRIPNPQDIIRTELTLDRIPVYNDWDAIHFGDVQPLNPWDLWFGDGTYVYVKDRWYDTSLAWKVWFEHPSDARPDYDHLAQVVVSDPANPAAHIDLQGIFKKSFVNAYAFYVDYYYSREFIQNLGLGQNMGELVGGQLGKRLARYSGEMRGFNEKYNESAHLTYTDAFRTAYQSDFKKTFNEYSSRAVLSIESVESVQEMNGDGLVEAGERFSIRFKIRNVGGQSTPLVISVGGDVEGQVTQSSSINRLSTQVIDAKDIAAIRSGIKAGQTARIDLRVNDQVYSLTQRIQQTLRFAPNDHPTLSVDAPAGKGQVRVIVQNISKFETPGMVKVSLLFNGAVVNEAQIGKILGNVQKDVLLTFNDRDPLDLIRGHSELKVIISMGELIMDDVVELSVRPLDANLAMARYFNLLINNKGFLLSETDRDQQLADLQAMILDADNDETRAYRNHGPNLWKDDPDSTLVGKLRSQLKGFSQSTDSKLKYDALAKRLWPHRKNLKGKILWLFGGKKRKAYEAIVRDLSKNGKL